MSKWIFEKLFQLSPFSRGHFGRATNYASILSRHLPSYRPRQPVRPCNPPPRIPRIPRIYRSMAPRIVRPAAPRTHEAWYRRVRRVQWYIGTSDRLPTQWRAVLLFGYIGPALYRPRADGTLNPRGWGWESAGVARWEGSPPLPRSNFPSTSVS